MLKNTMGNESAIIVCPRVFGSIMRYFSIPYVFTKGS